MKTLLMLALIGVSFVARADAQAPSTNAALRYWMAFAVMKDPPAGKDGLADNREALEIMRRATALPSCDWGLEYELGSTTPIAHLAKGRVLGRLNQLDGERLAANNLWGDAVTVWIAGVKFSQHLAQGGSLIAVLSGRAILKPALNSLMAAAAQPSLTPATRAAMAAAVRALPPDGFDWNAAMKREAEALAIYQRNNPGKGQMPSAARVDLERAALRADIARAVSVLSPASGARRDR